MAPCARAVGQPPPGGLTSGVAERVLLIEDDPSILRGLELNLGIEGFEVRTAETGARGLKLALEWRPDLVVLDIMLPELDGYEVCRRLRAAGARVPVIILSAKGAEMDKVMGLDLGADDFVTKPFSLHELLARVKAQLRRARTPGGASEIVRFGLIEADFARGEVKRDGAVVELTAREIRLLQYLVSREGRVVTRQMILDAVWGEDYFGTERTVDNFITRLRQKLDPGEEPAHLLTVRGMGYRFSRDSR